MTEIYLMVLIKMTLQKIYKIKIS